MALVVEARQRGRLGVLAWTARACSIIPPAAAPGSVPVKVTPGKMVYEIQPKLDWDKGKAVLYLLEAPGLDRDEFVPLYLGDDVTDEHRLRGSQQEGHRDPRRRCRRPEVAGRTTAADFVLDSKQGVERFLDTLAR